jgi:hypothetical protein
MKVYRALCKLWDSPEWVTKSKMARECRGFPRGHTYGPDGHIHLDKHMVRKIYSEYIYATNSEKYIHSIFMLLTPTHRKLKPVLSQAQLKRMYEVIRRWVVHSGGDSSTGELSKTLIWFSLIVLLSSLQFASFCRCMGRKLSRFMVKAMISGAGPLMKQLCMWVDAEGSMMVFCYLFLNFVTASYEALFLISTFLKSFLIRWIDSHEGGKNFEGLLIAVFIWY